MMRRIAIFALALGACTNGAPGDDAGFEWELPSNFPEPTVPPDNPMNNAKVELGRYLFYDTRLSGNQTMSCASCHKQELAFTDGLPLSMGSTGDHTHRNSMSLVNTAYSPTYTWASRAIVHFEDQALIPMFGEAPVELGLDSDDEEMLLTRLRGEQVYRDLFPRAFPDAADPFSIGHVVNAIGAFERTIISADSPFDHYLRDGDISAISQAAINGYNLFNSERLECFHCHGGFNFTDSLAHAGQAAPELMFHNNGLYNIDRRGSYPASDRGLYDQSGNLSDMGLFRAPTLRNIALTAPYMHDGSIATLDEVLDHYAAGGRTITGGPNAGDGSASPLKSVFIHGFELTSEERADVLAFLESLTDETVLSDPRWSDPWKQ